MYKLLDCMLNVLCYNYYLSCSSIYTTDVLTDHVNREIILDVILSS